MPLTKYDVTVTANVGGESKTKHLEVHADSVDNAKSVARSFTGPLWEVDDVKEKGDSSAPSGRKGFVGSHD